MVEMLKLVSIEILQPQLVKLEQFVSIGRDRAPSPYENLNYMCTYMYVAFYSMFHSLSDGEPDSGTRVALSLSQLLQLTPRPEIHQ